MGALVVFVQVLGGAVASFLVGMFWFSPVTFGRIWWRYQFPAKRFGEMEKCGNCPLYCTSIALVIQSAVLTFLTNALLLAMDPLVLDSLPALGFPLLGAAAITTVVSCASLPHHLFAGRPLPLFLICSGHDAAQITAAVFVIYALA